MYQLANDGYPVDGTQLFIQSCTSMLPTPENLNLVRSAASLVRGALAHGDVKPLRDLVRRAEAWCSDIDDVLAAAGQTVLDEMKDVSRTALHDAVRRVAQIERDVFAGMRRDLDGAMRPAFAG